MSFDIDTWGRWSTSGNTKAGNAYLYKSSADALAVITASAYFNDLINQLVVDDILYISASDGNAIAVVTSVTTNVTVEVISAQAGSHYVAFAGEHTTVGGAAAEAITVAGVLATDLVIAVLHTVGASPQTILTSVASADTLTVTFSADPSSDHVLTYSVLRAY